MVIDVIMAVFPTDRAPMFSHSRHPAFFSRDFGHVPADYERSVAVGVFALTFADPFAARRASGSVGIVGFEVSEAAVALVVRHCFNL